MSSTAHNIGLAIWRLKCFYETFVQGSTVVILLNFLLKIRHYAKLQTVNCYFKDDPVLDKLETKNEPN
jgi:hypothetical protein